MARGGARAGAGRPADPNSERSERTGFKLTALPSAGYAGDPPRFPLPRLTVWTDRKERVVDEDAMRAVRRRELAVWRWIWTTPQACAWALPSESWRLYSIALYVRTFVKCEGPEATAADKGSLKTLANDIGLTSAGLRFNGWAVVRDELQMRRAPEPEPAPDPVADDQGVVAPGPRRLRG